MIPNPPNGKWTARLIVLGIASGFILLGWNAHRTFLYAADIYRKAEICDANQCEEVAEVAEQLKDKLPMNNKKGEK